MNNSSSILVKVPKIKQKVSADVVYDKKID